MPGDHQLFVRCLGGAKVWTQTGAKRICHVGCEELIDFLLNDLLLFRDVGYCWSLPVCFKLSSFQAFVMCFSQTLVHGDHWWSLAIHWFRFPKIGRPMQGAQFVLGLRHIQFFGPAIFAVHVVSSAHSTQIVTLSSFFPPTRTPDSQRIAYFKHILFILFLAMDNQSGRQLAGPHPWGWDSLFGSSAKCSQLPRHWACTCAYA